MKATSYLRDSYVTRGGKIDPWGTIRILDNGVQELSAYEERLPLIFCPGLAVWSEKLVPYGKGNYRAQVRVDSVHVLVADGTIVEKIPFEDFVPAELQESYVHENGYLEYSLSRRGGDFWTKINKALEQAANGEKPCFLDNSDFTQVDRTLARKEVIKLRLDSYKRLMVIVFTKEGERLESKTRHPLSFAKWEPENPAAAFSTADED